MYDVIKTALEVPAPFNMIIVCTALVAAPAAVTGIAVELRKFATHRLDLNAKREMVDQGMTADEIERVLRARSRSRDSE